MLWPSYRSRYLPALSLREIKALGAEGGAYVVIPTGAVEQHGPHLPLGVDAMLAEAYLEKAFGLLPPEAKVYVAPPVQVGKSNEHTGFPGTLMISRQSLRAQILAIGKQLAQWGFLRVGVLNTHGGNLSVLKSALRELALTQKMEVEILEFTYPREQSERESIFGIHAGELESSLMYAIAPDLVDPSSANCEWIGELSGKGKLRPEFAPVTFAWQTLDLAASGTMGDATAGSADKGQLWLERAGASLAQTLAARGLPDDD